jgi:NAD(P)-dependent dehydrogenase (short-subunit alcohol dehydrogenase family)
MQRWAAARPDEYRAFIDKTPMKRAGDCEHDIGRFVVALCSDDCRYINGQSIGVDGGMACLG